MNDLGQREEVKEKDVVVQALQTIEAMESLMANMGWKFLSNVIQAHIDSRFSTIIEQRMSVDELVSQEYMKGEAKAMIMMKGLPHAMVTDAKQRLVEMKHGEE
jgi:hypothetical protein